MRSDDIYLYVSYFSPSVNAPRLPRSDVGFRGGQQLAQRRRGVFCFNNAVLVYQLWGCGLSLCNA